jgi:hypothetical protein
MTEDSLLVIWRAARLFFNIGTDEKYLRLI